MKEKHPEMASNSVDRDGRARALTLKKAHDKYEKGHRFRKMPVFHGFSLKEVKK